MKNTKRCMVMAVVLSLVLNLLLGLTVLAAESNKARIDGLQDNIDTKLHKIQVLSVDVTIPEDATDGYTFKYIDNNDSVDKTYLPYGYLRFKTTGAIAAGSYAENSGLNGSTTWLDEGYDKSNVSFTPGKAFNLTARLNKETGTVDYYKDGTWFYRQEYKTSDVTTLPINPWRVLLVVSDKTNAAIPTVTLKYSVGLENDVVGTFVNTVDEYQKTITVDFSENVTGDLSKAQLKCVNGGTGVTISNAVVSGSSVTFKYSGTLTAATEYALILPDDIRGEKYGNGLESNYLYFVSNRETVTVNKAWDFDSTYNISTDFYLKESNGTEDAVTSQTTESGGQSGEGILVKSGTVQGTTSIMYWKNYDNNFLSADTQVTRFHIKPIRDDLSIAIRLNGNGSNTTPLLVGFSKNGNILAGYSWENINTTNEPAVGTFAKGTWYDVKVSWNSADKSGLIQITPDGGTMITKTFTAANFGKISSITTIIYKDLMGITTTDKQELFVLDNVKFYGIKNSAGINQVRFNDTDGNTIGAFDKLENPLSSVDVTFSEAMSLTNEASENIKLYYGDEVVSYTAVYDETTNCYSMTPTSNVVAALDENYRVEIKGIATTAGSAIADYSSYVETDIYTFVDAKLEVVDESGEAVTETALNTAYTVKVTFESKSTEIAEIPFIVARYSDGNYVDSVSINKVSKDDTFELKIEDASITNVGIYAWDSLENALPMCESVYLPVVQAQ